jgi:hypothetical protein
MASAAASRLRSPRSSPIAWRPARRTPSSSRKAAASAQQDRARERGLGCDRRADGEPPGRAMAGKVREPFKTNAQGTVLNEETGALNEGTQLAGAVRNHLGAQQRKSVRRRPRRERRQAASRLRVGAEGRRWESVARADQGRPERHRFRRALRRRDRDGGGPLSHRRHAAAEPRPRHAGREKQRAHPRPRGGEGEGVWRRWRGCAPAPGREQGLGHGARRSSPSRRRWSGRSRRTSTRTRTSPSRSPTRSTAPACRRSTAGSSPARRTSRAIRMSRCSTPP